MGKRTRSRNKDQLGSTEGKSVCDECKISVDGIHWRTNLIKTEAENKQ